MPVQRMSDGTYEFGPAPETIPSVSKYTGRIFATRGSKKAMPVNPLLEVIKSRKMYRNSGTGELSPREATNLTPLYRPGGLLYKP